MSEIDRLRKSARINLWIFGLLFILFWVNVLLGKAKISFGWQVPFLLSDVAEYLLLLFTALFFILAAVGRESLVEELDRDGTVASGENQP